MIMDERLVCPAHGPKRLLISKRSGLIYRWCEKCESDPIEKIFALEEELREARREK